MATSRRPSQHPRPGRALQRGILDRPGDRKPFSEGDGGEARPTPDGHPAKGMRYVGLTDLLVGTAGSWLFYQEQFAAFHPPYKAWVVIGTAGVAALFLAAGLLTLAGRRIGGRIGEVASGVGVGFGLLSLVEGLTSNGMYGGVAVVFGLIVIALFAGLWLANRAGHGRPPR